jgi:hypothetical protein
MTGSLVTSGGSSVGEAFITTTVSLRSTLSQWRRI